MTLNFNCNASFPLKKTSRKDVRLPVQLQRAMAAEAEAAREARAKVLTASIHILHIYDINFLGDRCRG